MQYPGGLSTFSDIFLAQGKDERRDHPDDQGREDEVEDGQAGGESPEINGHRHPSPAEVRIANISAAVIAGPTRIVSTGTPCSR